MVKKIRYHLGQAAKLGLNIGLGLWTYVWSFFMVIFAGLLFILAGIIVVLLFCCFCCGLVYGGFIIITIVFDFVGSVEISGLVLLLCAVFFGILFHYDVFWDVVMFFWYLGISIWIIVAFVYGVYFCFFEW
ncbi:hypothetical protein [Candidatus Parabeggiatoa sp. HSG14]|uniref:hypothetical protein n=1 Tax=Candidatus Parabeggiatoa sp. HSG14 TaxID=3055593 RepID=UPI0025A77049|nr:hypothetical protein [Thiotrichales bacterium HSG14]